jgi:ribosomal silencing factor RsfS
MDNKIASEVIEFLVNKYDNLTDEMIIKSVNDKLEIRGLYSPIATLFDIENGYKFCYNISMKSLTHRGIKFSVHLKLWYEYNTITNEVKITTNNNINNTSSICNTNDDLIVNINFTSLDRSFYRIAKLFNIHQFNNYDVVDDEKFENYSDKVRFNIRESIFNMCDRIDMMFLNMQEKLDEEKAKIDVMGEDFIAKFC